MLQISNDEYYVYAKRISDEICKARFAADMSQRDVCENLNIAQCFLSLLECGDRLPSIRTLILLANHYDCELQIKLISRRVKNVVKESAQ